MITPLIAGEHVWGYMGIDLVKNYRNWNNEDFQWLSSLANIISICIELRKAKDEAVRERRFALSVPLHADGVYTYDYGPGCCRTTL